MQQMQQQADLLALIDAFRWTAFRDKPVVQLSL
jgi:hypothetical protein